MDEDRRALEIHGYVFSSESDGSSSDNETQSADSDSDQKYNKFKPPPLPIHELKDHIFIVHPLPDPEVSTQLAASNKNKNNGEIKAASNKKKSKQLRNKKKNWIKKGNPQPRNLNTRQPTNLEFPQVHKHNASTNNLKSFACVPRNFPGTSNNQFTNTSSFNNNSHVLNQPGNHLHSLHDINVGPRRGSRGEGPSAPTNQMFAGAQRNVTEISRPSQEISGAITGDIFRSGNPWSIQESSRKLPTVETTSGCNKSILKPSSPTPPNFPGTSNNQFNNISSSVNNNELVLNQPGNNLHSLHNVNVGPRRVRGEGPSAPTNQKFAGAQTNVTEISRPSQEISGVIAGGSNRYRNPLPIQESSKKLPGAETTSGYSKSILTPSSPTRLLDFEDLSDFTEPLTLSAPIGRPRNAPATVYPDQRILQPEDNCLTRFLQCFCCPLLSDWSDAEKEQLLDALKRHGASNISVIASEIPSKSHDAVKIAINVYQKAAKDSLKSNKNKDESRKAPLEKWMSFFEEISLNKHAAKDIVTTFKLLALYERRENASSGDINLTECYEFVADILGGKAPKELSDETMYFIMKCFTKVGQNLKSEDGSNEESFIGSLKWADIKQKTYISKNSSATNDPNLNALKIPPRLLKINKDVTLT